MAAQMADMLHLGADKLSIAYDSFVAVRCNALDLSGRIMAVIGHNGAGKSTLIKSLLGLLPARTGSMRVSMRGSQPELDLIPERHMAFCPEGGAVFADISVESYIRMWCRFKHGTPDYYRKEGARFIELMKIEPLLKRRGLELSKGQRRRVQTAIGFLCNPKLFLLDEPFDGLDVLKTHELADIIEQQSAQMAFVLSSHRMDVVERLADSFIVLKEGEVYATGPLEKICAEMAGQSYRIEALEDAAQAARALSLRFSGLLVNHIGGQIVLTGKDIDPASIVSFLAQTCGTEPPISRTRTSLVEAMNYHLRQIEGLV